MIDRQKYWSICAIVFAFLRVSDRAVPVAIFTAWEDNNYLSGYSSELGLQDRHYVKIDA